jgi:hypothetical protein
LYYNELDNYHYMMEDWIHGRFIQILLRWQFSKQVHCAQHVLFIKYGNLLIHLLKYFLKFFLTCWIFNVINILCDNNIFIFLWALRNW